MNEFEDTQLKLTIKNLIISAIGIVSIVSSFWIGYGAVMDKLSEISRKQQVMEMNINFHNEKTGAIHEDFERRLEKLEK